MKINIGQIIALYFAILFPTGLFAQHYINLSATDFPVSDSLPHYYMSINLGKRNAPSTYKVQIVFPEYKELNADETRILKKSGKVTSETPQLLQSYGISRKNLMIDVDIVPFVKRHGKYYRLQSFRLDTLQNGVSLSNLSMSKSFVKPAYASSLTSNRYASHSVLSSGTWVKIRVAEQGIYQLTTAQLAAAGFKDPTKVKLYGYGGLMQDSIFDFTSANRLIDDLEEVPLYRRNGSVLFYAEGTQTIIRQAATGKYGKILRHINNPYSAYSYYFLTEGDSPLNWNTLADTTSTTVADEIDAVPSCYIIENDAYSWFNGGRQFYDSYDFANGNSKSYKATLTDFKEPDTNDNIVISMSSNSRSGCSFSFTLNGSLISTNSLPILNGSYTSAVERAFNIYGTPTADNTITLKTTAAQSARLNFIRVPYLRLLNGQNTPFIFPSISNNGTPAKYIVRNATSNTRLWRIGRAGDPIAEMTGKLSGTDYEVILPEDARRYVTVDIAKTYSSPEIIGTIANQDLHADSASDLVIIIPTNGKFMEQAQRLADYHKKKEGLRTRIVRADQLYNEFGSGTPDATAYRRYLKMLYDRAATDADMPRYLILFGDCVWDNRMVTSTWKGKNPDDYLLAYESDYSLGELDCYVTDDYYGLLDDGEGANIEREKIDLGIGRLTAGSVDEAKILVDKAIDYSENGVVGNWKNTICMMADDGDGNLHMSDAETVLRDVSSLISDFKIKKIYWDSYDRVTTATGNSYPKASEDIKSIMSSGALIMNYTGHGAPTQVAHEKVLLTADFNNTSTRMPLWILASCELDPYDDPTYDNIGRTSVLNTKGGCVSFICASRTVYSDRNNYLNRALMKNLLTVNADGSAMTMGEAMLNTKISLVQTGLDRTDNRLKYVLLGDPVLTLKYPTVKVIVDSLNGTAINNSSTIIKAGSIARFSGHLAYNGAMLNDFTGTINATMFDQQQTITCKNNDGSASSPYQYKEWNKILFDGTDSIKSGKFSVTIPVPLDISYSENSCRALFYAVNNAKSMEAHGTFENFVLNGTSDAIGQDTIGPKISLYFDSPDFKDGGHISQIALFNASVSDESGINSTGNGVGHDLELCIDGKESTTYNLNSYFTYNFGSYTSGTISYQLSDLEEGNHSLTFRAWDLQNNSTTVGFNFVVEKATKPSLKVYTDKNPARTSVNFSLSSSGYAGDVSATIEIYDVFGRKIWTKSGSVTSPGMSSITWDLTTSGGVPVSKGLYFYRATSTSGGGKSESATKKIIVVGQ